MTITNEQVAATRLRAQTDLYYLCTEILDIPLKESVHRPMCDLFVKKDPQKSIGELEPIKQRLLLSPRNNFKTTIDEADVVQWILCYPNIRILILSGKQDLCSRMVQNIERYFMSCKKLRALFPEYCSPLDKNGKPTQLGTSEEFYSPARTENPAGREPTCSISTIASINTGPHFEVIKCDDIVTDQNSENPEQCQKVIEKYDILDFLLDPGGYRDVIGTRWSVADLYGEMLKRNEKAIAEDGVPELKTCIQQAWKVKEGRTLQKNEMSIWPIITKDDVDLLYPERIPFHKLLKEYRTNPRQFHLQRLMEAIVVEEQQFTLEELQRVTIPFTQLPKDYEAYIAWDTSGLGKNIAKNDRSAGIVGWLTPDGKLFIRYIMVGHFNSNVLPANIVELCRMFPARTTYIEGIPTAYAIQPTIDRIARDCNVEVNLNYVTPDNTKGAKMMRIGYLKRLMQEGRLFFAADIGKDVLDSMYEEFLNTWNPKAKNDVPDAIALLARQLPQSFNQQLPNGNERLEKLKQQAMYDLLFTEPATQPQPSEPSYKDCGTLGYGLNC